MFHAKVDQLAERRDAFAVNDVELGLPERRCHFVLHHFNARAVTDNLGSVLNRTNSADIHSNRRIELQRAAAGGRLGATEHHTDLLTDLVDEDEDGLRPVDGTGQLTQRLAHKARLKADVAVAHVALDLGLRNERRHGVDNDHIERAATYEHVADIERLPTGIRLRDEKLLEIDTELSCIRRIEGMLGVDKRSCPAEPLCLCDDVSGERCLTRRLRAVNFDNAATWHATYAQR